MIEKEGYLYSCFIFLRANMWFWMASILFDLDSQLYLLLFKLVLKVKKELLRFILKFAPNSPQMLHYFLGLRWKKSIPCIERLISSFSSNTFLVISTNKLTWLKALNVPDEHFQTVLRDTFLDLIHKVIDSSLMLQWLNST